MLSHIFVCGAVVLIARKTDAQLKTKLQRLETQKRAALDSEARGFRHSKIAVGDMSPSTLCMHTDLQTRIFHNFSTDLLFDE